MDSVLACRRSGCKTTELLAKYVFFTNIYTLAIACCPLWTAGDANQQYACDAQLFITPVHLHKTLIAIPRVGQR